jgi:hypothetical protein
MAPVCDISYSEALSSADIVANIIYIVFCLILLMWGLFELIVDVRNLSKFNLKTLSKPHGFGILSKGIIVLASAMSAITYSLNVHNYMNPSLSQQHALIRSILAGLNGLGLFCAIIFISLTWLDIIATTRKLRESKMKWARITLWGLLCFVVPANIVCMMIRELVRNDNPSLSNTMNTITSVLFTILTVVNLGVSGYHCIISLIWFYGTDCGIEGKLASKIKRKIWYLFGIQMCLICLICTVLMQIPYPRGSRPPWAYLVSMVGVMISSGFSLLFSMLIVERYTSHIISKCEISGIKSTFASRSDRTTGIITSATKTTETMGNRTVTAPISSVRFSIDESASSHSLIRSEPSSV